MKKNNSKKTKCFQCQTNFYIKFVIPQQKYSQKNNWEYWTGEKSNKKICDSCLLEFYHNKPLYLNMVKDLRKRQQMRTYIYHRIINGKNPLEDEKWLKEFSEGLKKNIKPSSKRKFSQPVREIVCTQENIGEPIYFTKESNKKTTKLLLQQVERYIKLGQIKIAEDSYEHIIGLSCQDYEFSFPDSWDYPQYYRIITDLNGKLMKNEGWKSRKIK